VDILADGAAGAGGGGSGGASFGGSAGSGGATESPGGATMFIPDDLANTLYRYSIVPNSDPTLNATIPVQSGHSVALRVTKELFVAGYSPTPTTFYRFLSPFSSPVANGTLAITGLSVIPQFAAENMVFVDDEIWTASPATSMVVRLSFDSQGTASLTGAVGNIPSVAGLLWNSATRVLYVSQRFPDGGVVQPYHVGSDHQVMALAAITGNALNGPDGIALTSWGELLVANYYGNAISRFSIDAQGNATPNETISGNGLSNPTSLALAPWGELFVGNQGSGTLSRFTFDAAHKATANGTFQTSCKASPVGSSSNASRLDGIAIFPTPSS
jgi:hypothetical protein